MRVPPSSAAGAAQTQCSKTPHFTRNVELILHTSLPPSLPPPTKSLNADTRLSPELGADEALIRQVAEASSFDSMKEQAKGGAAAAEVGGSGGDGGGSGGGGDKAAHLRKGVAGDWRSHFSPELHADFVERYRREMAGSGIVYSLGEGEEDLAA